MGKTDLIFWVSVHILAHCKLQDNKKTVLNEV